MDFYVYYKVQPADAASLQEAVIAMQAGLARSHGMVPQLKRRPAAADDGLQTWMEVYPAPGATAGSADALLATLEAAAGSAGLARWICGPRHVEVFEDLPPCA